MTDHKFEPFQKVLVRQTGADRWRARFYETQYADHDGQHTRYETTDNGYWWECIHYTPETAHLLGTSQPYEPPKPPVEYEWGQKVEVCVGGNGVWRKGIFIKNKCCTSQPFIVAVQGYDDTMCVNANGIRPCPTTAPPSDCLTDTAFIDQRHAQHSAITPQVYLTVI